MARMHYPDFYHRPWCEAVEGQEACLVEHKAADGASIPHKMSQNLQVCSSVKGGGYARVTTRL